MLRSFLCTMLLTATLAAQTATGKSVATCEPLFGGIRLDLHTPMPLHLLLFGSVSQLHAPLTATRLDCSKPTGCDVMNGVTIASVTIDRIDKQGWWGSYKVEMTDGSHLAGPFHTVPAKQRKPVVCM